MKLDSFESSLTVGQLVEFLGQVGEVAMSKGCFSTYPLIWVQLKYIDNTKLLELKFIFAVHFRL